MRNTVIKAKRPGRQDYWRWSRWGLLLGLPIMLACQPTTTKEHAAAESWQICSDPRPRVCTMIYQPVCAERVSGERETLSSPCNACADISVFRWRTPACDSQLER